ncbi:MAG TPA: ABC transporter [Cytophagales bacterium]|nr:ABC transporter [Cytophagales bacterium]
MKVIRQIIESFRFASNALRGNILRTILSLLGVTIGVFTIVGVLTAVDSLENNLKNSFNFLGTDVIYVDRFPFIGDPNTPWWTYWKRPNPSYSEYRYLQRHLQSDGALTIFSRRGGQTFKFESNSIGSMTLVGASEGYDEVFEVNILDGRYFTQQELDGGRNVVVIGQDIAEGLFPRTNPLGERIKIRGLRYTVIGVMEREGSSLLDVTSSDEYAIVPFKAFRKVYQTGQSRGGVGSRIGAKGKPGDEGLLQLENEMEGLLRAKRGLRPKEDNSFELNRPEAIAAAIGTVFDIVTIAGWVIGGFSGLVGGFSIANIMFVSVKERTSLIGVEKSLGAKNYFILFQFLFEAILLSCIGGAIGLVFVWLLTLIPMGSFEVIFPLDKVITGMTIAAVLGVVAGIIPAIRAAYMDPVRAIRS